MVILEKVRYWRIGFSDVCLVLWFMILLVLWLLEKYICVFLVFSICYFLGNGFYRKLINLSYNCDLLFFIVFGDVEEFVYKIVL